MFTAVCAFFFITCGDDPVKIDTSPNTYGVAIEGLQAEYIPDTTGKSVDKVMLRWEKPSTRTFDFYQVYRTTDTTETGALDTSAFVPLTDNGLHPDSTSYEDIVGLVNGRYFYAIRTVTIDIDTISNVGVVYDTIFGPWPDEYASDTIGTSILFAINDGDVFTVTDEVHVSLEDPRQRLDSIVLTQKTITYLVKGNDSVRVAWDDPYNIPSNKQLRRMIGTWIDGRGELVSGVSKVKVPDFTTADPLNPKRTYDMKKGKIVYSFPWKLLKGNGEKIVYVRLFYKNNESGTQIKEDGIQIAPWDIEINFRNQMRGVEKTMSFQPEAGGGWYYLFSPELKYSISIFSDTTIAQDFDCWFVTTKKNWGFHTNYWNETWLETKPKKERLTGVGPLHDDNHIYTYSINPADADAHKRLDTIRTINFDGNQPKERAFKLRGNIVADRVDEYNYTATPGSFWGPKGQILYWDERGEKLVNAQQVLAATPQENYDRLVNLSRGELVAKSGLKLFKLVARFKGRFFNDTRIVVSGTQGFVNSSGLRSAIDFYPPRIFFPGEDEAKTLTIFREGIINSAFDFVLDQDDGSGVLDGGHANIIDVELVFAKIPQGRAISDYVTNYGEQNAQYPSAEFVKENMQSHVYDYDIKTLDHQLDNVVWEDIDPEEQKWASGYYIVGVITEDEYHNRGWGISNRVPSLGMGNPQVVYIETSR